RLPLLPAADPVARLHAPAAPPHPRADGAPQPRPRRGTGGERITSRRMDSRASLRGAPRLVPRFVTLQRCASARVLGHPPPRTGGRYCCPPSDPPHEGEG